MSDGGPPRPRSESLLAPRIQFSLVEGDLVNRIFGWVRLGLRPLHLFLRSIVLVILTWGVLAFLAVRQGLYGVEAIGTNFFADFAAYAQFLVALPIFVVAEAIIGMNTREASRTFLSAGVVPARHAQDLDALHQRVARQRRSWLAETLLILTAYLLSLATIGPELCLHPGFCIPDAETWHSQLVGNRPVLTQAGWYAMLGALPVLNYWWLRWAWKIYIWTGYLYRVSRFRLQLAASHPDHTGGLGFISRVQAKFAWIIFAYGLSNVAAVVAYKIAIEGVSMYAMPVWAPVIGFAIIAPLLFTLPLFMFTKQLFRTKKRALGQYRKLAMDRARALEHYWLNLGPGRRGKEIDLEQHTSFAAIFETIEHMRVVPFDFRSIGQLVGSTLGSIAAILPLVELEGRLPQWLEFFASLFSVFR
jgi:hypothetical protein